MLKHREDELNRSRRDILSTSEMKMELGERNSEIQSLASQLQMERNQNLQLQQSINQLELQLETLSETYELHSSEKSSLKRELKRAHETVESIKSDLSNKKKLKTLEEGWNSSPLRYFLNLSRNHFKVQVNENSKVPRVHWPLLRFQAPCHKNCSQGKLKSWQL